MLWFPKDPKIKEGKKTIMWIGLFRVKKAFNNNIVQLSTLSNEDITLVNVNKLKVYQNPIIMVITFTIIKQGKTRILPNGVPRRIIDKMMQIYERFKLNEQKGEAQHNKNHGGKVITTLPKKWIKMTPPFIMT